MSEVVETIDLGEFPRLAGRQPRAFYGAAQAPWHFAPEQKSRRGDTGGGEGSGGRREKAETGEIT